MVCLEYRKNSYFLFQAYGRYWLISKGCQHQVNVHLMKMMGSPLIIPAPSSFAKNNNFINLDTLTVDLNPVQDKILKVHLLLFMASKNGHDM